METTIQQFIDYVADADNDLAIDIKINRREITMWVFDFTIMQGTHFKSLETISSKLKDKTEQQITDCANKLKKCGYQVTQISEQAHQA